MTEWGVVTVILVLLGLVAGITGPMVKLNSSITRLTVTLEGTSRDITKTQKSVAQLEEKTNAAHTSIYAKLGTHAEELARHSVRIGKLEEHK